MLLRARGARCAVFMAARVRHMSAITDVIDVDAVVDNRRARGSVTLRH